MLNVCPENFDLLREVESTFDIFKIYEKVFKLCKSGKLTLWYSCHGNISNGF